MNPTASMLSGSYTSIIDCGILILTCYGVMSGEVVLEYGLVRQTNPVINWYVVLETALHTVEPRWRKQEIR